MTDASGTINQEWLESAFLQKEEGTWKIVFMHSTDFCAASRDPEQITTRASLALVQRLTLPC
jgi:hypothetical protein